MAISFDNTSKKFAVVRGSDMLDPFFVASRGLTMWFKINSAPTQDVHLFHAIQSGYADGGGTAEAECGVYWDQSAGGLRLHSSNAAGTGTADSPYPGSVTLGQWHLLTVRSASNGNLRFYLDGSDTTENVAEANTPDVAMAEMLIGRSFDSSGVPETESLDCEVAVLAAWDGDIGVPTTHGIFAESSRTPTSTGESLTALFPFENDVEDTTGSATCEGYARHDFADDSSQFSTYTAPFTTASLLRSTSGTLLKNNGNANVVFIGDSFANDRNVARLTLPLINSLGNVPAGLIADASTNLNVHPLSTIVSASGDTGVTLQEVDNDNDYDIEGNGIGTPGHYAVPTTIQELTLGATASITTQIYRCRLTSPTGYSGTPINRFVTEGDDYLFSPIFKCPDNASDQLEAVRYGETGGGVVGGDVDLTGNTAGEAFNGGEILVDAGAAGASQDGWVYESAAGGDINRIISLQGHRWLRTTDGSNPVGGLCWATCPNDSSWSYSGFGQDATSDGGANLKRFSDAEYEAWYGAAFSGLTGQRPIIIVHLATEGSSLASAQTDMQAIVTRMDARHTSLGTPDPLYLFIIPGLHAVGSPDLPGDRLQAERYSEAAYNVAAGNIRVDYFSLYHATDGGAFYDSDGLPYGAAVATDPQRVWLANYDSDNSTTYDTDTSGILRDTSDLHLGSADAAEFEAGLLSSDIVASGPRTRTRRRGRRRYW